MVAAVVVEAKEINKSEARLKESEASHPIPPLGCDRASCILSVYLFQKGGYE